MGGTLVGGIAVGGTLVGGTGVSVGGLLVAVGGLLLGVACEVWVAVLVGAKVDVALFPWGVLVGIQVGLAVGVKVGAGVFALPELRVDVGGGLVARGGMVAVNVATGVETNLVNSGVIVITGVFKICTRVGIESWTDWSFSASLTRPI